MRSPFPGMNPYLEAPEIWSSVHHRLIVAIADAMAPLLRPQYRIDIEKRTYLSQPEGSLFVGIPDAVVMSRSPQQPNGSPTQLTIPAPTQSVPPLQVTVPIPDEVEESFLEIREVKTQYLIAVIEVPSPKNKRAPDGRQAYERKRQQILASASHLVEIDLLRGGRAMSIEGNIPPTHYRILVSRGDCRPIADLYSFNLNDTIPIFPLPLQAGDTEPLLDLQSLLHEIYDRGTYDLAIDYEQPPPPPKLSETELTWVEQELRSQGIRTP